MKLNEVGINAALLLALEKLREKFGMVSASQVQTDLHKNPFLRAEFARAVIAAEDAERLKDVTPYARFVWVNGELCQVLPQNKEGFNLHHQDQVSALLGRIAELEAAASTCMRDALEEAAKKFDALTGREMFGPEVADELRELKEQLK